MNLNLADILIKSSDSNFEKKLDSIIKKHSMLGFLRAGTEIADSVRNIVSKVSKNGDQAVSEFTEMFDNIKLDPSEFRISTDQLKKAHKELDKKLLTSLQKSIQNVKKYQSEIFIADKSTAKGIKYTPLKRVGLCIPGASAPLPSTVIMTAVPAQVAKVDEIVVVSPPRYKGTINPVILGLCYELGIKEIYRIGGAQAIAALAWGTETIRKVDKIAGPGNDYVQLAKKEVFGLVDMDSFAGPSDVLIIASDQADPAWVAADMLSQTEHNPGSAILLTDSASLAQNTLTQLEQQLALLERSEETSQCLKNDSAIVLTDSLSQAVDIANDFAPEHLEVQCGDQSRDIAQKIQNAGAIFIGNYTPVAVGDYWAGPSHTLPTRQCSKYFSALTSNDFIKSTSIIEYNSKQLADSANDIIRLANAEGLEAHAKSIKIRLQKK